jgi:hypothetical protein
LAAQLYANGGGLLAARGLVVLLEHA